MTVTAGEPRDGPEAADAGQNELKPSHEHLILYVFGSASGTLGLWMWVRQAVTGEYTTGLIPLALGAASIAVGILLHIRRVRLEAAAGHERTTDDASPNASAWLFGVLLWFGPLLYSWGQFELHRDPIVMFSVVPVFGACWTLWLAARRWVPAGLARRVLAPALVAAAGPAAGMLVHTVPLLHFTKHLSAVEVWNVLDEDSDGPSRVDGDLPPAPSTAFVPSGLIAQMEALATAEQVEVFQRPDGTMFVIDPDGSEHEIERADPDTVLNEIKKEARAKQEAARAEQEAARAAAKQHRDRIIFERRTSGRLFDLN